MKRVKFEDIIIKEDENFIFVNKPPFVSTLEDRILQNTNILRMAKEYHEDAQVCHRLDKETSGVLVIAKHPESYRHMAIQFEKRQVQKIYHAIVDGIHDLEGIMVNLPIHILSHGVVKIDYQKGKDAQTIFNTIKAFKRHTLVECQPITGRMHQIRIHLAQLKASIAGDEQYGGAPAYLSDLKKRFNLKNDTEEQSLIKRVALHARRIRFESLDGELIDIEAEYPKDFEVFVKILEKYS